MVAFITGEVSFSILPSTVTVFVYTRSRYF